MALIVEDGTGKTDANSYASVVIANAYFNDRGVSEWFGSNGQEKALVRATDYIELKYGSRFMGSAATETQALSWPRIGAWQFEETEIPVRLVWACCEYALIAINSDLLQAPAMDANGLVIYTKRQKVGPIETEFSIPESGRGSKVESFKPYPKADLLIAPLLNSNSLRLIR